MVPIVQILIEGYCFYRFTIPFAKNIQKAPLIGAVYSFVMLLFYVTPMPFDHYMSYGTAVFAVFAVMCLTLGSDFRQNIFLSVAFFALRGFANAIAEIIYDRSYGFAEDIRLTETDPDMALALYIGLCVLYLVLEAGILTAGMACILKNYVYKDREMSGNELLVLIIPSLMEVTGHQIIGYYRHFYGASLGRTSAVYDVLSLFYHTAAIITIVMMIVLCQKIKAWQDERLRNGLLAAQMDGIKNHIAQVDDLYHEIRSIRHDMTNHIITLERLYACNNTEEARVYGEELRDALAGPVGSINSGSPVTDVILQGIKSEAGKKHIRFDTDFHYPEGTDINAFDISIILNNSLQNALEYADSDAGSFISIISYRVNNAYMIEICNSFAGDLQFDPANGLLATSKGESKVHGYGLSNIRKIAEKYSGGLDISLEDGVFCLSIMLMVSG